MVLWQYKTNSDIIANSFSDFLTKAFRFFCPLRKNVWQQSMKRQKSPNRDCQILIFHQIFWWKISTDRKLFLSSALFDTRTSVHWKHSKRLFFDVGFLFFFKIILMILSSLANWLLLFFASPHQKRACDIIRLCVYVRASVCVLEYVWARKCVWVWAAGCMFERERERDGQNRTRKERDDHSERLIFSQLK